MFRHGPGLGRYQPDPVELAAHTPRYRPVVTLSPEERAAQARAVAIIARFQSGLTGRPSWYADDAWYAQPVATAAAAAQFVACTNETSGGSIAQLH